MAKIFILIYIYFESCPFKRAKNLREKQVEKKLSFSHGAVSVYVFFVSFCNVRLYKLKHFFVNDI